MFNKIWIALLAGLCALMLGGNAMADRHHHGGGFHGPRFGFYFGAPIFPRHYYPYDPFYYTYYPSYPPAVVTVPVEPPIYIERERPAQPQSGGFQEGYWYYCGSPEGYYPYVKECPGGWRQVDPIPEQ